MRRYSAWRDSPSDCAARLTTPEAASSAATTASRLGSSRLREASGAVTTGGWTKPHLHVLRNDGHTITVEFLAAPPPPNMTVIEAIVPIAATARIKSRGRITSVHAIAEANEITAQVLH